MSLLDMKREWRIRRVLRRLARQRVGLVLQPGNIWVIEKAVEDNEETDADLKTCFMRGWVEPLEKAVPRGKLKEDGSLPDGDIFQSLGPVWKLTDSGWAAINRAHEWTLIGVLIGALGVIVALST